MSIDYGITLTGFKAKSFDKIKEDLVSRAREYYGETLDERSTNPLIKFIEDIAQEFSYNWQVMQQMFTNLFIASATGSHLDKLGFEIGIDRIEGTAAGVQLKITGAVGSVIPVGTIYRTSPVDGESGLDFITETTLTIGKLIESYIAGPTQVDQFDDGDGPGGATPFDLTQDAYDDGNATCTFNGIPLTEVSGTPSAGEFKIDYTLNDLYVGNTLTTGDIVICTYTWDQYIGDTGFTLNKVPVDPIISLFRNITQLTEVASSPGVNEFSCNYTTGVITLGQTIIATDTFSVTYLDSTALFDYVQVNCSEIGLVGNIEANKITTIVTPISGVSSVTNPSAATGGTENETDVDYRKRLIGFPRTQWTISRIEAEVESVEGVKSAKIIDSFIIDTFVLGDEIGTSPLTFELSEEPFEPLKRAEIVHPSGSTVLTEVTGTPATGEYQVDYPSEVPAGPWVIEIFDSDLTVDDKLKVVYNDDEVGEGFFHCLVVGDETPLPLSVQEEVEALLLQIKPISIGFLVIDPDRIKFDTDSTITLDEGFVSGDIPDIQDDMEEALDIYLTELDIEDVLIRNELIKRFMLIDGVNDITELKFTLYDETHIFQTGILIYDLDWAQGKTVIYVKSLDKQTDYPYTFSETNNQITLTGATPANGETFLIKYESIEGNITARVREIFEKSDVSASL
jgi:hypothetical protein